MMRVDATLITDRSSRRLLGHMPVARRKFWRWDGIVRRLSTGKSRAHRDQDDNRDVA